MGQQHELIWVFDIDDFELIKPMVMEKLCWIQGMLAPSKKSVMVPYKLACTTKTCVSTNITDRDKDKLKSTFKRSIGWLNLRNPPPPPPPLSRPPAHINFTIISPENYINLFSSPNYVTLFRPLTHCLICNLTLTLEHVQ